MWVAVWQNVRLGYEMINNISNKHGGLANMISLQTFHTHISFK
jgi:hypothetical protein